MISNCSGASAIMKCTNTSCSMYNKEVPGSSRSTGTCKVCGRELYKVQGAFGKTDPWPGDNSYSVDGIPEGYEWHLQNWYNGKWKAVFRYPDPRIGEFMAAQAQAACLNNHCGYSQSRRGTFWTEFQKSGFKAALITTNCDADCSSSVSSLARGAGYVYNIEQLKSMPLCTTQNFETQFQSRGFLVLKDPKYLTSDKYLAKGDALLAGGHVVLNLAEGSDMEYLTAANPLDSFISEAEKHIGEDSSWTKSQISVPPNTNWSAAFISAVAKVSGAINTKIPSTTIVSSIGLKGVADNLGQWKTKDTIPARGDIVFFRFAGYDRADKYNADHCGIVTKVDNVGITDIEVDISGSNTVKYKQYSVNSDFISGYFSPFWDYAYAPAVTGDGLYKFSTRPYSTELRKEDATIREVGYMTASGGRSSSKGPYRLGVINYTAMVSDIWDALGYGQGTGDLSKTIISGAAVGNMSMFQDVSNLTALDANLDPQVELTTNAKTTISYFLKQGLNAAVSSSIAALIQISSGFDASLLNTSDGQYTYGLIAWKGARAGKMKKAIGDNWQTNFSAQLQYIYTELDKDYRSTVLNKFFGTPNTETGSSYACKLLAETYTDNSSSLNSMMDIAKSYYNQTIISQGQNSPNKTSDTISKLRQMSGILG